MNQQQDMEPIDLLDTDPNELAQGWGKKGSGRGKKGPFGFKPEGPTLIFAAIGIFILVILLSLLFRSCSKQSTAQDVATINARLAQLEEKAAKLSSTEQEVAALREQITGLQQTLSKAESSRKILEDEMSRLVQDIGTMTREKGPAAVKKEAPSTVTKKTPVQVKKRYHQVGAGETLYSIARKYGMSVGELCRLNNLSPAQSLHKGQKLIVVPQKRK
jgi:LysM repeat protein